MVLTLTKAFPFSPDYPQGAKVKLFPFVIGNFSTFLLSDIELYLCLSDLRIKKKYEEKKKRTLRIVKNAEEMVKPVKRNLFSNGVKRVSLYFHLKYELKSLSTIASHFL